MLKLVIGALDHCNLNQIQSKCTAAHWMLTPVCSPAFLVNVRLRVKTFTFPHMWLSLFMASGVFGTQLAKVDSEVVRFLFS